MPTDALEGRIKASHETGGYKRASAFLSDWLDTSLTAPANATRLQHSQRRLSLPTDRSFTLARRNAFSNSNSGSMRSGSLDSLVHYLKLHGSILRHGDRGGVFPPLPFRERPIEPHQQAAVNASSVDPPVELELEPSTLRSNRWRRSSSQAQGSGGGGRKQQQRQRGSCGDPEGKYLSSQVMHTTTTHGIKHRTRRSSTATSSSPSSEDSSSVKDNTSNSPPMIENRAVTFNDTVKVVLVQGNTTDYVHASKERNKGKESSFDPPSNHPTKNITSPSKFKSHFDTLHLESEGKPSPTVAITKEMSALAQPSTQLALDRASERLDGHFVLGDTFRSPKHQIIESDLTKALYLIAQLCVYDFAWILRSSREWTYAIVADFPENTSIKFVIDKSGKTKTLKMKHWAKCIRLVDKAT